MSAWSFYEIKHVCTGEGGMCLFRSEQDARRGRSLCHKGKGTGWWDYLEPGFSYPFTELQAAAGLASLEVYSERITLRRAVETTYQRILESVPGLEVPKLAGGFVSGSFKTPMLLTRANAQKLEWFVEACAAENLPVQKGYPALHRIPWIRERRHRAWDLQPTAVSPGDDDQLPVATDLHLRTINISTGPNIDLHLAGQIARGIHKVATNGLLPL
jgi:perosamine synthetase